MNKNDKLYSCGYPYVIARIDREGVIKMNKEELLYLLRCAEADLTGALEARMQGDYNNHDWEAHEQTIQEIGTAIETITKEQ